MGLTSPLGFSQAILLLIWAIITLVMIGIAYYLIKSAVQAGIRDAYRERNSGTAFSYKQTKLLAEIARTNGVSEQKIQDILQENT